MEERLFARRRDLFNDLDLVFFDTSALYFHGEGGQTLGRRGKSKDHRPELKQVVIGVVIDRHGRPLCSETWPGNATDVQALLPVIDRLRGRFAIGRICVVADRGMISAATITALEQRGLEYILGVRERGSKEVRELILADASPSVPLVIPRKGRPDTELQAKEVKLGDRHLSAGDDHRSGCDRAQGGGNKLPRLALLGAHVDQADLGHADPLVDTSCVALRRTAVEAGDRH